MQMRAIAALHWNLALPPMHRGPARNEQVSRRSVNLPLVVSYQAEGLVAALARHQLLVLIHPFCPLARRPHGEQRFLGELVILMVSVLLHPPLVRLEEAVRSRVLLDEDEFSNLSAQPP